MKQSKYKNKKIAVCSVCFTQSPAFYCNRLYRNPCNVCRCITDSIMFDSQLEFTKFNEVMKAHGGKAIESLEFHKRFKILDTEWGIKKTITRKGEKWFDFETYRGKKKSKDHKFVSPCISYRCDFVINGVVYDVKPHKNGKPIITPRFKRMQKLMKEFLDIDVVVI